MTTVLSSMISTVRANAESQSDVDGSMADASADLDSVALLVEGFFTAAGVGAGQTMDLTTFSKLCQSRDVVLQQCAPERCDNVEQQLKLMNEELVAAQQELLEAPRHQRAAIKKHVHRLDIVCRQTHDALTQGAQH